MNYQNFITAFLLLSNIVLLVYVIKHNHTIETLRNDYTTLFRFVTKDETKRLF